MLKKLLLFCLLFALFLGCAKLDPKIDAPSYLEIDGYSTMLANNDSSNSGQGTGLQKFTDVLVMSGTQSYGYYPIPGKIPLPTTGNTFLIIRPVIKVNGLNALRVDYPVMKGSDTTLPLTKGQITKFTPVFKYFNNVNFRFLEDFEGGTYRTKKSNPADTFSYYIDTTQKFNGGKKCLAIQLDATHTTFTVQSATAFPLPTNGTSVYVEINYKCNVPFEVGVAGTAFSAGTLDDMRSAGGALPTTTWKKLYFSLSDILRAAPYYPDYYLYFYATYFNDPKDPHPLNQIYIDNIKIISLQ